MIEEFLRTNIKDAKPYVPGRSKEGIAREYNLKLEEVIKLASNENPLGPSPSAIKEIKKCLKGISSYPDVEAGELRDSLSRYVGAKKDEIIIGNGSDEILELAIKMFLNPGEEAIIPTPTFSLYGSLVILYSGIPIYVPLGKDFGFNSNVIIRKITKNTKLVFICSPNNPTGSAIDEKDLRKILENGVVVILDEAYVEFAETSFLPLIKEYENLIVLRTFSKAFGLAGIRVGYGVANEGIIKNMIKIKLPFNVNLLAQRAAIGALKDKEHLKCSVKVVKRGRKFLYDSLSEINSVKVYPSKANFLLIKLKDRTSAEVTEALLMHGIIVRDCSSFDLKGQFIRVSIGTMEENQRFLKVFKRVLEE